MKSNSEILLNMIVEKEIAKRFDTFQIESTYQNRTAMYCITGVLNRNYNGIGKENLKEKLKYFLSLEIEKKLCHCDPDINMVVFSFDRYASGAYYIEIRITPYYARKGEVSCVQAQPIEFTDEWGEEILDKTMELMEKELGTTVQLGWGAEVCCGGRGMDTAIAIQGASIDDVTEDYPERRIVKELENLFECSMCQCLNRKYPKSEWKIHALFTRDTRDEDTFEVNVDIKEVHS